MEPLVRSGEQAVVEYRLLISSACGGMCEAAEAGRILTISRTRPYMKPKVVPLRRAAGTLPRYRRSPRCSRRVTYQRRLDRATPGGPVCTHRQAPCSAGHSRDLGLDMGLTHRGRHSGRGRRHCRRNNGHLELPPGRLPTVRVTTRLDEQDFLWRRNGLPDNSLVIDDHEAVRDGIGSWRATAEMRSVTSPATPVTATPWAADLYAKARARKCDHSHAVRILARAWATIIWKCSQDNTPYNPGHHDGL